MELTLCAPCLLGLEGLVKNELRRLGIAGVAAENGRVYFTGGPETAAKANLGLRCGERVLIELGRFRAESFDALFEGVRALPWESLLPKNAAFPVKGHCLSSRLMSVPDCQRIVKKAVAERMKGAYGLNWFPEDGPLCQIRFTILKDRASLCLDTTGAPLYKRGYRPAHVAAPLRETLAAGLVEISGYRGREDFADPFCGSGTIPIEAALIAKNRAPGLNRNFAAMSWPCFGNQIWSAAREEARGREFNGDYRIFASDIDPRAVKMAEENAKRAGVDGLIRFSVADAARFERRTERGILVSNPPYGERISDKKEAEEIYAAFGEAWRRNENWSACLLSSHTEFERCFGKTADKKRKLYNGMIKCDLFIYERTQLFRASGTEKQNRKIEGPQP